jgi:hypothetical protein
MPSVRPRSRRGEGSHAAPRKPSLRRGKFNVACGRCAAGGLGFEEALPRPRSALEPRKDEEVLSLLGAALVWSGWRTDAAVLKEPCLVIGTRIPRIPAGRGPAQITIRRKRRPAVLDVGGGRLRAEAREPHLRGMRPHTGAVVADIPLSRLSVVPDHVNLEQQGWAS